MKKKESPKNKKWLHQEDDFNSRPRLSGFSGRFLSVVKFILGLLLLPFLYSSSAAFIAEFNKISLLLQEYFWAGAITLLLLYLFIWEPAEIYIRGQKIVEVVFRFFSPLVRVAPYLLPIYTIILFILYWPLSYFSGSKVLDHAFFFAFGFSLCLHLVFGSKSLRQKKDDFLKANYLFGFSLVYIINLALLSFFLSLALQEFSFVNYSNNSFQIANNIITAVVKQLFLR